jgi:hypothetical protein
LRLKGFGHQFLDSSDKPQHLAVSCKLAAAVSRCEL